MKPSALLRKKDDAFKRLKAKIEKLNEYEILNFMTDNQDVIRRLIVEKGENAILA